MTRRSRMLAAAVMLGAAAVVVQAAPAGGSPSSDAGVRAVRAHVAQYVDHGAATAAGFAPVGPCEPGMGYHHLLPSRLDGRLEPARPEVLLYGRDADGAWVLLGAEYVVVDTDQDVQSDGDRPALFGHEFQGPMEGHAPGMPVHYDLHVWTHHANPDGGFAQHHAAVACAH